MDLFLYCYIKATIVTLFRPSKACLIYSVKREDKYVNTLHDLPLFSEPFWNLPKNTTVWYILRRQLFCLLSVCLFKNNVLLCQLVRSCRRSCRSSLHTCISRPCIGSYIVITNWLPNPSHMTGWLCRLKA